MGMLYSRCYYSSLYYLSNHVVFTLDWFALVHQFQVNSNQRVRDLTLVYKQGQLDLNWGRQLAFFRLVKEIQLNEREWNELIVELNK